VKAVVCEQTNLTVADVPAPEPESGQAVVAVTGCGICGSDLHARFHADEQADILAEAGYPGFMRRSERIVFGHEFCGEVVEHRAGQARKMPAGTPVVAMPLIRKGGDIHPIGLSSAAPGAYAEQVLVQEALMLAVPNGLSPEVAVLTEPLAIALHAVQRSGVTRKDVAIVVGCGPVGLAVIAILKARRTSTIVASDPAPGRRALAQATGADVVVDPQELSPYVAVGDRGFFNTIPAAIGTGIDVLEKMQRLPVPWERVWRLADRLGATAPKRPVIFECVGVPGMIDGIISGAPLASRVVVVGVCDQPDQIRPVMAINKEIDLRFVVGYSPLEFRDALHLLADGRVNATSMVTGTVGLNGVSSAFDALGRPDQHAKVIIDPRSQVSVLPGL